MLALDGAPALAQANLQRAFPQLRGGDDTWHTSLRVAGNGDNRFYRVAQAGRIRSFVRDPETGSAPIFLDISDRVFQSGGLIDVAFHPNYEENGWFYVVYLTEDGEGPYRWRLSRFERGPDLKGVPIADPQSETMLLDLEAPGWDHLGGSLQFGPDGYLYVTIGDIQCCNDPNGFAQDRTQLFGKLLRLDVDTVSPEREYGIPPDNPFSNNSQGWREEIYAFGFRNPWSMSVDPVTGEIWIGDVGEVAWEEVNLVVPGGNHGWNAVEGPDCNTDPDCDPAAYEAPLYAYPRTEGRSIIGGHVYRGDAIPDLQGHYIFADWVDLKLWSLSYDRPTGEVEVRLLQAPIPVFPSGFERDEDGELFTVHTFDTGAVYELVSAKPISNETTPSTPNVMLRLAPNPATDRLRIEARGDATLASIYDATGRLVTETRLQPGCNCATVELDAATFSPGMYLVRTEELSLPFTVIR